MAFLHRIPAIFTASFCVCALGMLALSGISCEFLEIQAHSGYLLNIPDSGTHRTTYAGIICGSPLYKDTLDDSLMFLLSRCCLIAAIAMGSFTSVLAIALSSFVSPTESNWKLLGVFASVSTLFQMPIFLLYESEPCVAYGLEQECFLAHGSFYLIISSAFWVAVVVATQFLDPPRWADELNAWRSKTHEPEDSRREVLGSQLNVVVRNNQGVEDEESQAPLINTPRKKKEKGRMIGIRKWISQRRWDDVAELPKNKTDSLSIGDEEGVEENRIVPYEGGHNTSGLVLDVLPNGRRLGDDSKSVQSFDDLDSFVMMVEEGRLPPECRSLPPPSRNASFATDGSQTEAKDDNNQHLFHYHGPQKNQFFKDVYADLENSKPADELQAAVHEPPPHQQDSKDQDDKAMQFALQENIYKSSKVIRNLTDNLKRKSKARRCKKNMYALMDDDDTESPFSVLPSEIIVTSDSNSLPDPPGSPTRQADFPCFDPRALKSIHKRRSFDDGEYPDPIISHMGSNEEPSSEEGEPDPIIYSSSYSYVLDIEEGSIFSSSSSESSSSDDYRCSSSRGRRRAGRSRSLGYSSVQSVLSATSLLDTMIAEETDEDLVEIAEICQSDFVRSKSAPAERRQTVFVERSQSDAGFGDAGVPSLGSDHFRPLAVVGYDDGNMQPAPIILADRSTNLIYAERTPMDDVSDYLNGSRDRSRSISPAPLDLSLETEVEDPVDTISFSSGPQSYLSPPKRAGQHTVGKVGEIMDALDRKSSDKPDPEGTAPENALEAWKNKCASRKLSSPVSPAVTAPETPSPFQPPRQSTFDDGSPYPIQDTSVSFEAENSWKVEREIRCGIHAASLDDDYSVVDEDTRPFDEAREARIRRLQRAKDVLNRTRAQSQGPSIRRRQPKPPAMAMSSSVIDSLDLQLKDLLRDDDSLFSLDEQSL